MARTPRIFLLSPARADGVRMALLTREAARFPLACDLRAGTATLGACFQFASGLYFRGKLAYAQAFARAPAGTFGSLVIAPGRGLLSAAARITVDDLRAMGGVPVDAGNPAFVEPLVRDARRLAERLPARAEVVLLGSIASPKYVDPLLQAFGERLRFPLEFVGRGDMSRGGLLLRCVREGRELTHVPVAGAVRKGARPPKLPKLARQAG